MSDIEVKPVQTVVSGVDFKPVEETAEVAPEVAPEVVEEPVEPAEPVEVPVEESEVAPEAEAVAPTE